MKSKISKRQIARFCSQLQLLLSSGVPLLEALRIIENTSRLRSIDRMIQVISEGESLAGAMEQAFPPLVISSIASAERAGNLEETLARLSRYYENQAEVEEKLKSALIYPGFIMGLSVLSLVVIFVFVLPGFRSLFADLDTELPLFTSVLIGTGELFSRLWYLPVGSVVASTILLPRHKDWDRWLLKFRFCRQEMIIQSLRSLGSLLAGGVPVVEALQATINSIRNRAFRNIITGVKQAVENGERLSAVMSRHAEFPREAIQMVAVGENTGKLADMLISVADFYEKERELFIKRFTTMLEPALTLFVGLIVAVVALAMFLPMVSMISKLQ